MESTREQMLMIHTMCRKEINLLKVNLDKFIQDSERCQKLLSELNSSRVNNIFGLIVFDRYMTQMVTVLNMARKYNIHLEINNLDKTVINASSNGCLDDTNFTQTRLLKDFIDWRKTYENDLAFDGEINDRAGRIKMTEHISEMIEGTACGYGKGRIKSLELNKINETNIKRVPEKTNEKLNEIENLLEILLPRKNLCEFENCFEFEACVVFVRDYKKLEFLICLNDDYKTLYDLSTNTNFKQIPSELLPPDDVFCVSEKTDSTARECLWRAVIVPHERNVEYQKLIYLLDFGEVIPLTDRCKTYEAPLRYRQIPPLAIKCILEGVEDSFVKSITKDQDKCKRALQKNEFEKKDFRILYKKDQVLHVVMLVKKGTTKSASTIKNNEQTNPFLNTKYVEIDDENSCADSVALQLPRSVIYQASPAKEAVLNIFSEVGSKIPVIVTHVVSPVSFYGIIKNNCDDYRTFSWSDHQIFTLQRQISPPQLNDIILSQYIKDGYWYRAKVINIDSEKDFYKVFYVDFGNTEVVPLSGLAKCSKEQLKDPLRAVLFHLSNLSIVSDEQNIHASVKNNLKSVIENMVVMLLDQVINLEVIERRNDDLVVRIIDSQYADIPKMLVDTGVVAEIKN